MPNFRKSLCLFVRTTFLRLKNFSKSNKAFDKKEKNVLYYKKPSFAIFNQLPKVPSTILTYRLVYMSKMGMEDGDKALVDKGSEKERKDIINNSQLLANK